MRVMASSPPNTKPLEKILAEAELSGNLNLSNRRLKELSQLTLKYDLLDVTRVNLARNRLSEIPLDSYEWQCLQELNLSYNSIKAVSELISEFKLLKVLDLSNNLISTLPPEICRLHSLLTLRLSNNNLISLPEEIGKLRKVQEMDVSSNELTSIPSQISQMTSLVHLNIRRNKIHALPEEISTLSLTHFDAGCNLITVVPVAFRNLSKLRRLDLAGNPLSNPKLHVLRKGRIHLLRELEIQAEKAQIKREVMDDQLMSPMKKNNPKSDLNLMGMKSRALSISDVKDETAEKFAEKAAELSKDRRKGSVPSSPEKKPRPKKEEKAAVEKKKKKVNGDVPVPAPPSQEAKPVRVERGSVKNEKKVEMRRSSSSGNMERKNSKEALLIHQKLSGFPNYKTHTNEVSANGKAPSNDKTKEKLQEFVKNRQALSPTDRNNQVSNRKGFMPAAIKPRSTLNRMRGNSFNTDKDLSFTMRRKTEKLYEELEMMENLRQSIEARLKVSLGDDIPASLSDGVVLCHLTNQVRPRSLSSIHVPSPAVPKLNLAKRRRNIDNFLDACQKIGVPPNKLCSAQDILLEKNIGKVAASVNELLKFSPNTPLSPKRAEAPSVKVAPSLITKQQSAV